MRTRCPCCGASASLDVLIAHEDARDCLRTVFAIAAPLGTALVRYLTLWRPSKRELSLARVNTVLIDLLPLIEAGAIPRKGRDWAVNPADWCAAIEQMLLARDAGKLTLPLTSHGYLLEVLAGLADKQERVQEQATEAQRRDRSPANSTVPGKATDIAAVLAGNTLPPAPPPRAPGTSPLVRRMKAQLAKGASA